MIIVNLKVFDNVVTNFVRKNDMSSDVKNEEDERLHFVLLRVSYFGKCSIKFARSLSKIICHKFSIKVRLVYINNNHVYYNLTMLDIFLTLCNRKAFKFLILLHKI